MDPTRARIERALDPESGALWMTDFATGNNVAVERDTLRRILPIRIESICEKPEERQGFKYHPLLPHILLG